jgi:hypothetical protein
MRFLAFDCLVVDGQNIMSRPLDKRYGVRHLSIRLSISNPLTEAERLFLQTICKNEERSRSRNEDPPFRVGSSTCSSHSWAYWDPVYGSRRSDFHTMQSRCLPTWATCNMGVTVSFTLVSTRRIPLPQTRTC